MIKYTLCPVENHQTDNTLINEEEYLAKVFKHLETENLEDRLYHVQVGQRILLYSFEYGPEDFVYTYFTSTGANSGYFSQVTEWPGRSLHYRSANFTFE